MRKAAKQIILCAVALAVLCTVCGFLFFRDYTAVIPLYRESSSGGISCSVAMPEVLEVTEVSADRGCLFVRVRPRQAGSTDVTIRTENGETMLFLRVDRFHGIYDYATGGFTGDVMAIAAVSVFLLLVSAIMAWHFRQARGPAFYAYSTIYYAGFSLFSLMSGLAVLFSLAEHLIAPASHSMLGVYSAISGASTRFMKLTMPLMLAFAVAMAMSNIALLRHERPVLQNVLGLLVSVLLVAGEAAGWLAVSRDFMGSEQEARILSTLQNTYATVFVYFQSMLTGSVICGIQAARHAPAYDKDFIIVLGCWFRQDGTLPPLLKGRVDRAVSFWREQKEKAGKEAFLVPSGGQGKNEPMPEAEAMRQELLRQGIPGGRILPETRSRSTLENMKFSGEIIHGLQPDSKVLFATTNYHVFRSGVWANQAGLPAEGVGSRTRWWFWPNAFMRETIGLLQKRWKQELLLLLFLIGFFGVLSLVVF